MAWREAPLSFWRAEETADWMARSRAVPVAVQSAMVWCEKIEGQRILCGIAIVSGTFLAIYFTSVCR